MKCVIEKCDNVLSPRSELKICALCRATINRWAARRPGEVLERQRKLTMYGDRLNNLNYRKGK
jgi:hypothetical protein